MLSLGSARITSTASRFPSCPGPRVAQLVTEQQIGYIIDACAFTSIPTSAATPTMPAR
jgi:hypothetical protein